MAGISSFFWLLIIGHLIGDFYLQSDKLVAVKKVNLRYLLIHGALYTLPVFLVMALYADYLWCVSALLVITISHFFH